MSDARGGHLRNVLHGFSSWLLPLGLSIVATPVVVRALGPADYGIYALVVGFIAYSFNFNLGRAVTKYVAEYRAAGRDSEIGEVIAAAFVVNLGVGAAGMAAIALTAPWLVREVFLLPEETAARSVLALDLAGATIFATMIAQVFNAVVQGLQRFDVYAKLSNVNNLVFIGGNLALALSGFGLIGLLVWNLGTTFAYAAALLFATRSMLGGGPVFRKFGTDRLRLVAGFSWGVIGYQLLANFFLLFERSWVTRKFGAESLTYYVVPMTVAIYLHGFVSSLTLAVFPLASERAGDADRLAALYLRATKIVLALVVILGAVLAAAAEPFLTLWIGQDFADRSSLLLVLHTATFSLAAVYIIAFQTAEGAGKPWFNLASMAAGALVGVPLMIALSETSGTFGVAVARLVCFGIVFLSVFVFERLVFGGVKWRFWVAALPRLLVTGVATFFVFGWVHEAAGGAGWPAFLAGGAAATVAGGASFLITGYFGRNDLDEARTTFLARQGR